MNIERDGEKIKLTDIDRFGNTFGVRLSVEEIAEINEFLERTPFEPGFYMDNDGDLWFKAPDGTWFNHIGGGKVRELDPGEEPESEFLDYGLRRQTPLLGD